MSEQEQKKVWPKFERKNAGPVWICPVTHSVLRQESGGDLVLNSAWIDKPPVAEVAAKLGIILEGVNDAPTSQAEPAPAPLDPVALLIEGRRLRYVRDPESDCRGPWGEVVVCQCGGPITHRGILRGYDLRGPDIATMAFDTREQAARAAISTARQLGYRFDSIDSD